MKTEIMTVTPTMAMKWVETHSNYRDVRSMKVDQYATDMTNGDWDINGESIKFDKNGALVDGQHRLLACIKSGVSFRTVVVKGVGVVDNIDTGSPRNYKDVLKRRGEKNSASLAANVAASYRLCVGANGEFAHNRRRITVSTLDRHYTANPELRDVTNLFVAKYKSCPMPSSKGAGLYYEFAKRDEELATQFFLGLCTGESLEAGDPVFTLREKLIKYKTSPTHRNLDALTIMAYTIKAWNAWRENRKMYKLVWVRFGKNKEAFPEIL